MYTKRHFGRDMLLSRKMSPRMEEVRDIYRRSTTTVKICALLIKVLYLKRALYGKMNESLHHRTAR